MDQQNANPPANTSIPALPPTNEPDSSTRYPRKLIWQGKIGPAFWTVTGILSMLLNAALIVFLILLGREVFTLKNLVSDQLVGGLAENFALMDEAVIQTNVVVNDQIPIQFTLPVNKKTTVVLTTDAIITGARVNLSTGGLTIFNAPTDIILPEGTPLDIKLDMEIPVETTIPVTLYVPVNIPLNETELHQPFVGLQQVVQPYQQLLNDLPNSWEEVLCVEERDLFCRFVQNSNR
jgi:hypothetical protein